MPRPIISKTFNQDRGMGDTMCKFNEKKVPSEGLVLKRGCSKQEYSVYRDGKFFIGGKNIFMDVATFVV